MSASTREIAAAERARWLFELAQAIDEAQCVAWRLGAASGRNPEALELYMRLEAARAEVEALRGRIGVDWLDPLDRDGDASAVWDVRQTPSGSSPPPEKGSR